uniref:Uncharacterized protein n=1 Tax=Pavo cristatus TaxID=9049 RepID=A0A8C9FV89_PAVCR
MQERQWKWVPEDREGSNPVRVSFVNVNDQSGNGDRLCFNVGRELYFYIYKGVRKVPGLSRRAGGLRASAPPARPLRGRPPRGRGAASWVGGSGTAGLTAARPSPAPCAARSAACEGALGQGERRPGQESCVRGLAPAPYRGVCNVWCRTRRCVGRWGGVGSLGPSSLCRNGGWVSNGEGTAGLLHLLLQVGGCRALMPGVITVVSNPRG